MKETLMKEAIKRKFTKGAKVDNSIFFHIRENTFQVESPCDFEYDKNNNSLYLNGWIIFKNDKWATIE